MKEIEQTSKASLCPSCGGALRYDEKERKLVCGMCGSSYLPESISLIRDLEIRDSKDADSDDSSKHEIVCDSCGAVSVTDENTAASFCPFCGSPSLVAGRLRKEFRPDYIIPFSVTASQARKIFLEWAGKYRYAPKDFLSEKNVNRITGLYVPFWLINAKCSARIGGVRYEHSRDEAFADTRLVYSVEKEMTFGLKNVPFDASKRINDRLMEAVEPFDWKGLKEYNDGYLPGFFAERYDTNALEMSERIISRLQDYSRQAAKAYTGSGENTDLKCEGTSASDLTQNYVLLPIWFLNYRYKGINYSFAINGQTGESAGDIPYSEARRRLSIISKILPGLLVLLQILSIFILPQNLWNNFFYVIGMLSFGMTMLILQLAIAIISKIRNDKKDKPEPVTTTLDKAPSYEEYYDPEHKAEINGEDKFLMMQHWVVDMNDLKDGGYWM
ncbi:MAG: zinc ribbon domain-containing protein [Clostridiales bacterium]|nr:zinc ribbon domain-containing protein [Clostridiales bacterium]